jgi:hypothetical protein
MVTRKRETERIEKENHAFAKRLFDKQAILNKKQLDGDWHAHTRYKRQIQKLPPTQKKPLIGTVASNSWKQFGFSSMKIPSNPKMQVAHSQDAWPQQKDPIPGDKT